MLECPDLLGNLPTVGENLVASGMLAVLVAESKTPLLDGGLELKGKGDLFRLDDAVGLYGAKKLRGSGTAQDGLVEVPVALGGAAGAVDAPTVPLHEVLHDRQVAVRYVDGEDRMTGLGLADPNATVSVEEASPVTIRHQDLQVTDDMLANSVELRCPARKGAEGQYRAKQERDTAPGVCNEHGPAPKGKMCSELGGNVERSAEMTGPSVGNSMCESISQKVTDCNTNYLHFVVDPTMLFEWTEPLKYTTQLASTRLCASRMFLRCTSRMFHAVLDGFSA